MTTMTSSSWQQGMMTRYESRGVSPLKEKVHTATRNLDKGAFPHAFCRIVPDVFSGDSASFLVLHSDGVGSKTALAYLHFKETGDASVFRGIAQDAVVMNTDDMLCVGALGPFLLSNIVSLNSRVIPDQVLNEIVQGFQDQVEAFRKWDIPIILTGGETADVTDLARTLAVDATMISRVSRERIIANDRIKPGNIIIGLASYGQTTYEREYNSGIGSNGLTSARHELLTAYYGTKYPETFDPGMPVELRYCGPYRLVDRLTDAPISVGEALLSPTRSFAPVIRDLLEDARSEISALFHMSGSGQTKELRTGQGIHYVKDSLFPPPPLFAEIQRVSRTPWREMYQVFNMGHRMEVIGSERLVPVLEEIGKRYRLDVRVVGHCEASPIAPRNQVTVVAPDGERITYDGPEA